MRLSDFEQNYKILVLTANCAIKKIETGELNELFPIVKRCSCDPTSSYIRITRSYYGEETWELVLDKKQRRWDIRASRPENNKATIYNGWCDLSKITEKIRDLDTLLSDRQKESEKDKS